MTDKEKRTDDMRNIIPMEYERTDRGGQTRGWWLRLKRGNQSFSHFFSYNKYGGKENALIEAKRIRDKLEEEHGEIKDLGYQTNRTGRNKSGMIGVHKTPKTTKRSNGKIYIYENWVATWINPLTRKRMYRAFAISKYGEAGAMMLAIKAREEAIAQISGIKQTSTSPTVDSSLSQLIELVETSQLAHEKGRALEMLAYQLFLTIPGFSVIARNAETETEEIDIIILNNSNDPRFIKESAFFL